MNKETRKFIWGLILLVLATIAIVKNKEMYINIITFQATVWDYVWGILSFVTALTGISHIGDSISETAP